jgi:hypothetical protein
MSEVINPPEYYFTGIDFNPSFYAQDAGGLSEATANALYLRKTVADTATAQETFTQPILVSQVKGLTPTSIMYVGNNLTTTGSLLLGNTGIRTKNQGIFETSSIRTPATNGPLTICTDQIAGGTVEIGGSASTTTINSDLTLNKPITIGYSIPSLSSQIGGNAGNSISGFLFNTSTTITAFCVINGMPAGRYLFQAIAYFVASSPVCGIQTKFGISSSTIALQATSGVTYIGDNALENFTIKSSALLEFSVNPVNIIDVTSANPNVALGIVSTVASTGNIYARLTAFRIG